METVTRRGCAPGPGQGGRSVGMASLGPGAAWAGSHQQDSGAVEDGLQVDEDGRDACQLLQEAHQQGDDDGAVHVGVPGLSPRQVAALETRGCRCRGLCRPLRLEPPWPGVPGARQEAPFFPLPGKVPATGAALPLGNAQGTQAPRSVGGLSQAP